MLRPLPDLDEVKLFGATLLAFLPAITADTLAERLGVPLHVDPDFLPGLGTFHCFACEIDDRVLCTIASPALDPKGADVIGHTVADLPAIAHALGIPLADFEAVASDPPKPWVVVRQDDNGNRAVLNRCETRAQAERAAALWTRRIGTHHQVVFVEHTAEP